MEKSGANDIVWKKSEHQQESFPSENPQIFFFYINTSHPHAYHNGPVPSSFIFFRSRILSIGGRKG